MGHTMKNEAKKTVAGGISSVNTQSIDCNLAMIPGIAPQQVVQASQAEIISGNILTIKTLEKQKIKVLPIEKTLLIMSWLLLIEFSFVLVLAVISVCSVSRKDFENTVMTYSEHIVITLSLHYVLLMIMAIPTSVITFFVSLHILKKKLPTIKSIPAQRRIRVLGRGNIIASLAILLPVISLFVPPAKYDVMVGIVGILTLILPLTGFLIVIVSHIIRTRMWKTDSKILF